MKSEFILSNIRFLGFEGDDGAGGDGGDDDAAAKAAAAAAAAAGGGGGKTYTEEEFNTHMAGLRRKADAEKEAFKKTQRELAAQLELAKQQKGLTEQEKAAHQARIEELENQFLTETEKAKRTAQQKEQEFTGTVDTLTNERDMWRGNFEKEAASNQVTRAAATNKAFDPGQIGAILSPMIEFKEQTDDSGAGTGSYSPVVKFPDIGEDEKPIVMEYSVDEAVKRMTELPRFANLFQDTMKSGIGGSGNADPKKTDVARLARDNPAEYRRLRKEKPELIYGESKGNR
jgi:molecular chaperone GrpE (heat shock protein)